MLHRREPLSPEALERAVRARLVIEHGAQSLYVLAPFAIEATEIDEHGQNWQLVPQPEAAAAESASAALAAAAEVAHSFNLKLH